MESKNLKIAGPIQVQVIFTLLKKILSFLAVGTILERLLSECVSYYSGYGIHELKSEQKKIIVCTK